ncbi:MAG: hypothetical protein BV456_09430 [Thermoplasmata archaeon M8B2D]|nr:MAG: hypothetical protein BV456_09430 [Thermoplasmata archaeon M8B2D]
MKLLILLTKNKETMKILKLQAENIKKIKAIDITPKNNSIIITGKNGAGKTSVLDSIYWAIAGAKAIDKKPIRDGETEGQIALDLGDKIVIRKFKVKDNDKFTTSLIIQSKDGATYSKPQDLLDSLIGNLSFDPLLFSQMKPQEQFDELKKIVKIDFDFEENKQMKKSIYNERTFINREIKQLEGEIAGIQYPDDTPNEEIKVNEISNILYKYQEINRKDEVLLNNIKEMEKKIISLNEEIKKVEKEIELTKKERNFETINQQEIEKLQQQINSSSEINKNVSNKKRKEELKEKLENKKKISEQYTEEIKALEESKIQAISKVKMPVENLSFGDNQILYNNIPLEQVNSAKKLEISCAIAMSSNSELKVLRVKNGSLLDEESLNIIKKMAKDKDYQLWLEKVDTTGKVGIVIENGEIKKVNN